MRRGFASIGLHNPKTRANVGSVLRAAMNFDVASVAISGERIDGRWIKSATNTTASHRHIPVMRGDLRRLVPYGAVPVAVDLVDDAEPLPTFRHPESAFYIFGPEDGTLGAEILDWCQRKVMVPTRFCMNLAATVHVILYDRLAKLSAKEAGAAMPPSSSVWRTKGHERAPHQTPARVRRDCLESDCDAGDYDRGILTCNDAQLDELVSRAKHYATGGVDDPGCFGLVMSARATLKRIAEQVPA